MAETIYTREQLKNMFLNGAKPTETEFASLIDSVYNKSEDEITNVSLPIAKNPPDETYYEWFTEQTIAQVSNAEIGQRYKYVVPGEPNQYFILEVISVSNGYIRDTYKTPTETVSFSGGMS